MRLLGRYGLWLLLTLLIAQLAIAAPKEGGSRRSVTAEQVTFEQAQASYLKIKQSDPNVTDLAAWERGATKLVRFASEKPKAPQTPQTYALLGELYELTYSKRQFRTGLTKAVYYYEKLASEFSGNALVPPALLRLGDLRRGELKDEAAARAAYYELVDVYPRSAQAELAKVRLGLEEPTASNPGPTPAPTPALEASLLEGFVPAGPKLPEGGKEIVHSPSTLKRPTIVIDAGHGGDEQGALGVNGVYEKDVTLNIAKHLDQLLRDRLRANTILTRDKDKTLILADRTRIANEAGADLFISVHANASELKTSRGVETYYLDNTNDKSSLRLAQRENASQQQAGTDLGFIISDFIQSAKLDESISLAHQLQQGVHGSLSRYYEGVRDLGVKKAPFYVLVGAHMPCVLVEVSFIDHPAEGARLITQRYQNLAALGIYQGIKAYFEQHEK